MRKFVQFLTTDSFAERPWVRKSVRIRVQSGTSIRASGPDPHQYHIATAIFRSLGVQPRLRSSGRDIRHRDALTSLEVSRVAAQREPHATVIIVYARFDIRSSTTTISLAGHVLNANAWRRCSLVGIYISSFQSTWDEESSWRTYGMRPFISDGDGA